MSSPVIELSAVTKSYGAGDARTPVLRGVSLSIEAGDYVALMGASGSGKSTMMNLMGLLDRCDQGSLKLQGQEAAQLDLDVQARMRNQYIGFVFQSFNLLRRVTVLENVALPLLYAGTSRGKAMRAAQRQLDAVGLGTYGARLPSQLSGGQQQRVAIARALVNEPPLLLADEPTGNLDTQTSTEILDVLEDLNRERGLTIVLVTHEPDVAARARRLVRLKDGMIETDQRQFELRRAA